MLVNAKFVPDSATGPSDRVARHREVPKGVFRVLRGLRTNTLDNCSPLKPPIQTGSVGPDKS
jgi:hypothetical protein